MIYVCEINISDPFNILKFYECDMCDLPKETSNDVLRCGYSRLWIGNIATIFIYEDQFRIYDKKLIKSSERLRNKISFYPISDNLIIGLLRSIKIYKLENGIPQDKN